MSTLLQQIRQDINNAISNLEDDVYVNIFITSEQRFPYEKGQTIEDLFNNNAETLGINPNEIEYYKVLEENGYVNVNGSTLVEPFKTYSTIMRLGNKGI